MAREEAAETAQLTRKSRKPTRSQSKDAAVGVRLANDLKLAAVKAATAERRSVSSLMEKILVDYLLSEGYLNQDETVKPPASQNRRK